MTWNNPKTAGLVIGVLLLSLLIAIGVVIYYRRKKPSPKLTDTKSQAPSSPDPEIGLVLPSALVNECELGTVYRRAGAPQTFCDWVRGSDEATMQKHGHYPSLENGPGPVVTNVSNLQKHERCPSLEDGPGAVIPSSVLSVYSRPTYSRTTTTARPETNDSWGASSFRKAVLDAAEPEGEVESKEMGGKSKDVAVKEKDIEGKKEKEQMAMRGYSGAWP